MSRSIQAQIVHLLAVITAGCLLGGCSRTGDTQEMERILAQSRSRIAELEHELDLAKRGTPAPQIETLAGKIALITGTSSGLGRSLAEVAAKNRMKLVMVDIDEGPSQEMAVRFRRRGLEVEVIDADLSLADERKMVVEHALKRFGHVDYLFNNAGYLYLSTLEERDDVRARHQLEVNYWAYVDLAQKLIPTMKERRRGHIVNIASMAGVKTPNPEFGFYAATKHALVGLFEVAAQELQPYGIKVLVVCPGLMRTRMFENAVGKNRERLIPSARDTQEREPPMDVAEDVFANLDQEDVLLFPSRVKGWAERFRQLGIN